MFGTALLHGADAQLAPGLLTACAELRPAYRTGIWRSLTPCVIGEGHGDPLAQRPADDADPVRVDLRPGLRVALSSRSIERR
ncbi:hypothetical protein DMB66_34160 [Actinoplanes sp. ATCC 53533]|nr:hypothetical protein DMB66_34160 [Actinoplanes sp. ATCC 53533]